MDSVRNNIIIYDAQCKLCSRSIQFIIKFDKKNIYTFTPLDSTKGKKIIKELDIDIKNIDSIILKKLNKGYIKSSAIIKIIESFGGFWLIISFLWIIPIYIRDFVYDIVAKNRYKWFGKSKNCLTMTPEIKDKFIS